jgi:hypothetical protein
MLKVVLVGNELRDPDTNALLGYEDTEVATIQIIEIQSKLSKGRVLEWKSKDKEIPKGSTAEGRRRKKGKQASSLRNLVSLVISELHSQSKRDSLTATIPNKALSPFVARPLKGARLAEVQPLFGRNAPDSMSLSAVLASVKSRSKAS